MKYYQYDIIVPDVPGISFREMEDPEYGAGTYVVYSYTKHVKKPEPHDEQKEAVIGKLAKLYKGFMKTRMYANENYVKLFKDPDFEGSREFPEEYMVTMGPYVYMKALMEKCGLWDDLKECLGDLAVPVADLAICLVCNGVRGTTPRSYVEDSPILTDGWTSGDLLVSHARRIKASDMSRFVKVWAARMDRESMEKGMCGTADSTDSAAAGTDGTAAGTDGTAAGAVGTAKGRGEAQGPKVCLLTDLSYWERVGGTFFTSYENRIRPDVVGPKGYLPQQNFVLALREADCMPLFYKDLGFSASKDLYDESIKLCSRFNVSSPSFLLKRSDMDYGVRDLMTERGYDYICEMESLPVHGYEYVNAVKGTFEENWKTTAYGHKIMRSAEITGKCSEKDEAEGTVFVYYNGYAVDSDLENAEFEVGHQPETAKNCMDKKREIHDVDITDLCYLDLDVKTEDGSMYIEGYRLNEERAQRGRDMAGYSCIYSTAGDERIYAPELFAVSRELGRIIGSNSLNKSATSFFDHDIFDEERQEERDRESWQAHNNEVESFIKFIACIIWQKISLETNEIKSWDSFSRKWNDAVSAIASMQRIFVLCTRKGRATLRCPLDGYQRKLLRSAGVDVKNFNKILKAEGKRYIDRQMV